MSIRMLLFCAYLILSTMLLCFFCIYTILLHLLFAMLDVFWQLFQERKNVLVLINVSNSVILSTQVGAPARVGLVAPIDVIVPPGNTGLDPSQTSFFQVNEIHALYGTIIFLAGPSLTLFCSWAGAQYSYQN